MDLEPLVQALAVLNVPTTELVNASQSTSGASSYASEDGGSLSPTGPIESSSIVNINQTGRINLEELKEATQQILREINRQVSIHSVSSEIRKWSSENQIPQFVPGISDDTSVLEGYNADRSRHCGTNDRRKLGLSKKAYSREVIHAVASIKSELSKSCPRILNVKDVDAELSIWCQAIMHNTGGDSIEDVYTPLFDIFCIDSHTKVKLRQLALHAKNKVNKLKLPQPQPEKQLELPYEPQVSESEQSESESEFSSDSELEYCLEWELWDALKKEIDDFKCKD